MCENVWDPGMRAEMTSNQRLVMREINAAGEKLCGRVVEWGC